MIPKIALAVAAACTLFTVANLTSAFPSSGDTLTAAPQDPKPPAVNPRFQPEIARLAREGLQLAEAVEADLGPPNLHHLAAVFKRPKAADPSQQCEFMIIENDGASAKTIFRRNDFFFSFELEGGSKLNATDINKDGLKEIIVQSSSGGNCWACNPTEIYQLKNSKIELIAAAPILKIADLNGDGIQDLVVTDARWEAYDDLSHAAAPGASMVYTWAMELAGSGVRVNALSPFGATNILGNSSRQLSERYGVATDAMGAPTSNIEPTTRRTWSGTALAFIGR